MALVRLGCTLPFTTASAIELSVCIGAGGCLCPNSSKTLCMYYTASRAIMYKNAANSASVAHDIIFLIMCAMLRMAPLLGGSSESNDMKKWPPALLRALFTEFLLLVRLIFWDAMALIGAKRGSFDVIWHLAYRGALGVYHSPIGDRYSGRKRGVTSLATSISAVGVATSPG
eukprot:scaffold92765_cov67-Cyclotella_meneghiniana.AAC.2